jgi:WD40 repeat protein
MLQHKLEGHKHWVSCVAISADGRRVASGSLDKTIRVWDINTGQCTHTLEGHESAFMSVDFSMDGMRLVGGGGFVWDIVSDHTIKVFSVGDGQTPTVLQTLQGHKNTVWGVKFSPDGKKIASASWDCTLAIWNCESGEQVQRCRGHHGEVYAAAWSPDSKLVASGGGDNVAHVWSAETGTQATDPLRGHTGKVSSVAFGADSCLLVTASFDTTIKVWDLAVQDRVAILKHTLVGHTRDVNCIALSPHDRYIASAGDDGTVRIWQVDTGKQIRVLEGHARERVLGVAWSRDGLHIVSGGVDQSVCVWTADVKV